jgi:hypothetical protein
MTSPEEKERMQRYYADHRVPVNEQSRDGADHYGQPWCQYEDEIVSLWDQHSGQSLTDLANLLGRTREGCRSRFYNLQRGEAHATITEHDVRTPPRTQSPDPLCPVCFLQHRGTC